MLYHISVQLVDCIFEKGGFRPTIPLGISHGFDFIWIGILWKWVYGEEIWAIWKLPVVYAFLLTFVFKIVWRSTRPGYA